MFSNIYFLFTQANDRKNKLMDGYDLQRFLSDFRDLQAWINGMKTLVCSDELAKDVTGAEALLERHQVGIIPIRLTLCSDVSAQRTILSHVWCFCIAVFIYPRD